MKRFLVILLGVFLIAATGVFIAVMRLDAQNVRDQIAEKTRSATGKPLLIKDTPALSLAPLGVKFGAAYWGISPDGGADPAGGISAAVKSGQVSVQFLPLLSGRIAINELLLDSPDIRIAPGVAPVAAPKAPETPPPSSSKDGPLPPGLEIDTLSITNGSVSLETDSGQIFRLSKLNVSLHDLKPGEETRLQLSTGIVVGNPRLQGALTLKTKARLQTSRWELNDFSAHYQPESGLVPAAANAITLFARGVYDLPAGKIALSLLKFAVQGGASDLACELSGEADFKARAFNGKMNIAGAPRRLAQAFGAHLPLKKGFESVKLQNSINANERAITLDSLQGMLDNTSIEGKLTYEPAGTHLRGNLRFGAIDVDALTAGAPVTPEALAARVSALFGPDEALAAVSKNAPPPAPKTRQQQTPAAPKPGASTQPQAGTPAAQNNTPAGVSALPSVDLELAVASVTASKLRFKDIHAVLRGRGVYRMEPLTFSLGTGGAARLSISVDADAMRYALSGKISDVAVGPLLQAVQGKRPVDGTADANLDGISCAGTSDKAIRASLAGKGLLTARGITLNGVSLLPKDAPAALGGAPSHFEQLTVPFTADNGQIHLAPVSLLSRTLTAQGQGVVRLPQENVDFTADIKLLAVTVPIVVSGPFNAVSYGLDGKRALEGLAKTPGALLEGAKELGSAGGQKAGSAGQKAGEAARGAGKALRNILR